MRDEAEAQELYDAYAETLALYRRAFGEPAEGTWIATDAAKCQRRACKPAEVR